MSANTAFTGPGGRVTRRGYRTWRWALSTGLFLALLLSHRAVVALPSTSVSPLTPLARIFDVVLVGLVLLLARAAGARCLHALELRLGATEGAAFATALGLGLIAYAAFGLGLVGLYRPPVLLAALVGAGVCLRRDLLASLRDLVAWGGRLRRNIGRPPRGVPTLAILLTLGAGLALLGALTPPHHYDPLTYHLALPQRFLQTGSTLPLPDDGLSHLPLTVELLYGVGLAFGSEVFGQLLHLAFAGITAAAVWALTARHFDRLTGWLAVAVFASTPLVPVWARVANIDIALGCFILLAVAAALRAYDGDAAARCQARRWLALAGVFAGFALGSKYFGLFALVPLGMAILLNRWWEGRSEGWRGARAALADACVFGLFTALVASPWYLKSWILWGHPVWPFTFGVTARAESTGAALMREFIENKVISPRTPVGYLLLPLRAYIRGDFEQRYTILSPLFLLLPALVALPRLWRRWRREFLFLLAASGGFIAGWTTGVQELRYLLAICGPLSILTAAVLRAAWERRAGQALARASLIGAAVVMAVLVVLHVGSDWPAGILLGWESRDSYLANSPAYGATHKALSYVVAHAGPGERALIFNDTQVYYLPVERRAESAYVLSDLFTWSATYPTPERALAELREEGIAYLVVNEATIRWWGEGDPEGRVGAAKVDFDRLTQQLELVYRDGPADRPHITIYRVPGAASVSPR